MKKNKTILVWLCTILCMLSCTGCVNGSKAEPILKVITSSQVGVTIFSNKHYYIVFDNGKTNRTSQFETSNVISHRFVSTNYDNSNKYLSGIDIDTPDGKRMNKIAERIVMLTKDDDDLAPPGAIYVIKDKIYFSIVLYEANTSRVALFEYVEIDDAIKKVATFKGNIEHVQAYE